MISDYSSCRENEQAISEYDCSLHPLFSNLEMNVLNGADSVVLESSGCWSRACTGCLNSPPGTSTRCESSLVSLAASRRESPPETPNEDQHTPLSPQCSERQAAPSAISVLSASDPTVRSGSISAQCHSFSIPYHPCQSKLTACSDAPATSPLIPAMSELRTKQESAVRAEAAGSISFTTIAPLRLLTDSNSVIHIPSAQTTIPSEDSMSLKSASSENLFAILPDSSQNSNLFMKVASIPSSHFRGN